ncbi:MAG: YfiR family protein [Salibacteraceae bacterium]
MGGLTQTSPSQVNTRAKMKSMFIYNFTKYTEWPESYKQGEFVIGIVGDDALASELENIAKTKKINSQSLIVKKFNSSSEVTKCHVLYVSGKAPQIEPYSKKAKNYSCLVVTEASGAIDNLAAINFIVVGAQLKYEMNKALFKNQGLVVSKSLENLAAKVIN